MVGDNLLETDRKRYADDITVQELVRLRVENERLREALLDMSFYISGHNWTKLKPETCAIYDSFTQNEAQILATNTYEAEGRN